MTPGDLVTPNRDHKDGLTLFSQALPSELDDNRMIGDVPFGRTALVLAVAWRARAPVQRVLLLSCNGSVGWTWDDWIEAVK